LVYDQGSDRNEAEIVCQKYQAYPQIKSIRLDKNYGFAQGGNLGINEAFKDSEVKYVVCLNNDTVIEPDFVTKLVETARQGFDMVGAQVFNYTDHNQVDNFGMEVTASMLTFNRLNFQSTLFCPSGCAVLYSRQLLEQVKLENNYFDPDFFCYAEDWDLGFRALLQGFKPAIAETKVFHKGSASTSKMSGFSIYHTYRNSVWVILKNLPTKLLFKYILKIKLGHWAIILKNTLRGDLKLILKAYICSWSRIFIVLKQRQLVQLNRKITDQELEKFINSKIFSKDYL